MAKKRIKWIVPAVIAVGLISVIVILLNWRGKTDIVIDNSIERITITSTAFDDMSAVPDRYTGNGVDVSPDIQLSGLSDKAVSIAVIMEDLDVPWAANYTHWVIWNIPARDSIPQAIPHGETVSSLDGAIQGVAYGLNRYRGPKPPFGTHRYQFHVFVLDCMFDLDASSGKSELVTAMDGHILQYGTLTGWYPEVAKDGV